MGSVTPDWTIPSQLKSVFDGTIDLKGGDFAIGVGRGRALGGEWGIEFVHKSVKDGSTLAKIDQKCGFSNGCFQSGDSYVTSGVAINGIEIHKYVSFVTIKDHVQIGMNLASGIGAWGGNVTHTAYSANAVNFNTNPPPGVQGTTVTTQSLKDAIGVVPFAPLEKIQLAVSLVPAPMFKIRLLGGFDDTPAIGFTIQGVYYIGAK